MRIKTLILIAFLTSILTPVLSQVEKPTQIEEKIIKGTETDSAKVEQVRTQSGVDPTRIQTRVGYSIYTNDPEGPVFLVFNRLSANFGIGRWSINTKFEWGSRTGDIPGTGFHSGIGDFKFSLLNAFLAKGKHAMAASAEFALPTGKQGIGLQYFSTTPSLTYSYTIKTTLVFALQPQYTFALAKDPISPPLSSLTIRSFLGHFSPEGYFVVFEARPIFNFNTSNAGLILSPILGKSIGKGFNLAALAEFAITENSRVSKYQIGFN